MPEKLSFAELAEPKSWVGYSKKTWRINLSLQMKQINALLKGVM